MKQAAAKKRSASLRWRVTLAFGLLGAVLSGLFAGATTFITEHYEEVLLDGMLTSIAADIGAAHAQRADRPPILPQSHTLNGFLRHADGSGNVPAEYSSLPPGMHEVDLGDEYDFHVGVFDLDDGRLYLAINLADVESLETGLEQILTAIFVIGTLIAAWLGWLLAGRTIAPVRRLAEAVESLPTLAQATQFGQRAANDELGRLAIAIDGYQERLVQADARERAFFADASHELRTPLAVVRGTAELLLDDGQLANQPRARIERLDRGVQTLADLLEVLLGLARGTDRSLEIVEVAQWLDQALMELPTASTIKIHVAQGAERLLLRPREAGLVLRGIIRRMERSQVAATIEIRVESDALMLELGDSGTRSESTSAETARKQIESGDRGLGATLIGRLAAQMEWTIDEARASSGCIAIRLPKSSGTQESG